MTAPDPVRPTAPLKKAQFVRIMRWAALFCVGLAATAVFLVVRGGSETRAQLLITTALGVGLTVLLGIALLSFLFLGSRSGHSTKHIKRDDHDS